MTFSLHRRILLLLTPVFLLTILQGLGTVGLLYQLHTQIELILRENYDSVRAMEQLQDALETVDASFQLALQGEEKTALTRYKEGWAEIDRQFDIESHNITIHPQEDELVAQLDKNKRRLQEEGARFFQLPSEKEQRSRAYFGSRDQPGLTSMAREVRGSARQILRLNQEYIEKASSDARILARWSLLGFAIGLGLTGALAAFVAWRLTRTLLRPIEAVTSAARAIGEGHLHRSVPVIGDDELAQLAHAFNNMTQRLRDYRQSSSERLLRTQKTSQATIDSFPDPILVIDPEGRVEMANPAARRVLGVIPRNEAGGSPLNWQPPDSLRQALSDALRLHQSYLTTSYDQAVTFRLDNLDVAFLPQIRPIRDPYGDTLGAAVVFNDVTRFRLMDQLKTDLVQTVSHELKTPLASIRLALHLLLEEVIGPLSPKQTELLLDARDNAERLLQMIEHLLALARLEQGADTLHLQPVAIADLFREAADAVSARAEGKRIILTLVPAEHLPRISGDSMRLRLALQNLLDNAITYTENGGEVTLSAETSDEHNVRLVVADTGIGIAPEYLPHVFDKFFRVPEVSQQAGTGLGLAIVKEIVASHRGTITCISTLGKGTSFVLNLPIWKEGR